MVLELQQTLNCIENCTEMCTEVKIPPRAFGATLMLLTWASRFLCVLKVMRQGLDLGLFHIKARTLCLFLGF